MGLNTLLRDMGTSHLPTTATPRYSLANHLP